LVSGPLGHIRTTVNKAGISHPCSNKPFAIARSTRHPGIQKTPRSFCLIPTAPEFLKKILKISVPRFLKPLEADEVFGPVFSGSLIGEVDII